MKFHSYRNLLEHIHQSSPITLTVSIWTYSSGRLTFEVAFEKLLKYLDRDMNFKHGNFELGFTSIDGKVFKRTHMSKIKIAKVDYVEYEGAS